MGLVSARYANRQDGPRPGLGGHKCMLLRKDIRRILLIEKCDDNGDLVLTSSAKVLEGLFNPFPGNRTDLAVGVYDST